MATPSPTAARFPEVPAARGHYESWYLKACDPARPRGLWIRYTVHKRPDADPNGSLWFAFFDRANGAPRASKVTLPAPRAGHDGWIEVGESRLGEGRAVGAAPSERLDASWEIDFASAEEPLFHLPRLWMYGAPVPRTKPISPRPAATFGGRLLLDGEEVALEGWRGMVGHNWGAQHAERWIWLHGLGFEGTGDDTWIDMTIGRVKLGPLTTPWIANGVLCLDGARHRLGGPGAARSTDVREAPDGCRLALPGGEMTVHVDVGAPKSAFVGWVYADPDGSEHHAVNCSAADMALRVMREGQPPLELRLDGGAAYELGMRERDHGVEIQPFPDG